MAMIAVSSLSMPSVVGVDDGQPMLGSPRQNEIGQVDSIPDVAMFGEIDQLSRSHDRTGRFRLGGGTTDVRRDHHAGMTR